MLLKFCMIKEFFLVLALTALSVTYASAQSTLGYSYADLQKEYNANSNLINWEDDKHSDGATSVSYIDKYNYNKGLILLHTSYFINEESVSLFMLSGKADEFANIWATYANNHFTKQAYGIWIDYSTNTRWQLKITEEGTAIFKATRVTD